jgi:hypothetical protein
LLERDPVHRHDNAIQRQRHGRRSGPESSRPSRRASLAVQGGGQGDKSREQERCGRELADVDGRPDPTSGIRGEDGRVVVGIPTGMHLRDDDVQELPHEQQGGGHAHRCAVECCAVHDDP